MIIVRAGGFKCVWWCIVAIFLIRQSSNQNPMYLCSAYKREKRKHMIYISLREVWYKNWYDWRASWHFNFLTPSGCTVWLNAMRKEVCFENAHKTLKFMFGKHTYTIRLNTNAFASRCVLLVVCVFVYLYVCLLAHACMSMCMSACLRI